MHDLTKILDYKDIRILARQQLPKFVFDFIEGGAGNEQSVLENESAFRNLYFCPRIGLTNNDVNLTTNFLGRPYSAPFGIAPMGLCGLVHPKADIWLANAAAKFNIPYIMSTTASTSMEKVIDSTGIIPWFQLYASSCKHITEKLLERIMRLDCEVLVITLDVATPGRRLRDLRNGLAIPFQLNNRNFFDLIRKPNWLLNHIRSGTPTFPNLESSNENLNQRPLQEIVRQQTGGSLDWSELKHLRKIWPGSLILKGVHSPNDACLARELGIDAIILSNHGGRQLDCVPTSIEILRSFNKYREQLPKQFLTLDSGIRSGVDVAKALACGSAFTFIGRPFLFALAAAGPNGIEHFLHILIEELTNTMKLLGASCPSELPQFLRNTT